MSEDERKVIDAAVREARMQERDRCAKVASEWLHGPTMLLRAGEMTLQERRTAMAIVAEIKQAIQHPR